MTTNNFDPRENNKSNFKTGAKVTCKDPVFFDEEIDGFVAKQLDDRHFLVKLDRPFRRMPRQKWLKVCRDYGHQVVSEK